jgi:predicted nucleic acid-binding protein
MARAVVDASVAIRWVVDEPGSALAHRLRSIDLLVAPAIILAECGNALWRRVRLGLLDAAQARDRLAALRMAPVKLRPDDALAPAALDLALGLDHPICDCLYLALALDETAPLITADRRLLETSRRDHRLATLVRPLDAVT